MYDKMTTAVTRIYAVLTRTFLQQSKYLRQCNLLQYQHIVDDSATKYVYQQIIMINEAYKTLQNKRISSLASLTTCTKRGGLRSPAMSVARPSLY